MKIKTESGKEIPVWRLAKKPMPIKHEPYVMKFEVLLPYRQIKSDQNSS